MGARERAVEVLSKLVSIPSPSGREMEISLYIRDHLSSIGYRPELHEVYKTGYNVLVRLGNGGRVMVCGHLDTVPELDMKDPYRPVVRDGRLYGRGACDMKGGLTSMLIALEDLARGREEPDAVFAFVVDEEMYGRGAAELMIRGVRSEICIIPEPTSMKICVGNAGCIEFKMKVYGRSGHGASSESDNAIIKLYEAYRILEEKVSSRFTVNSGIVMKPVTNLGKISGGYGAWVVPWEAEAEILVHFHPDVSYAAVLDFLRKEVRAALLDRGINVDIEPTHGCDGFICRTEYVDQLSEAHRKILGRDPEIGIVESETDANALFHKSGIKCIVYGPGEIRYAHSSEENVPIDDVVKFSEVLKEFLKRVQ